MTYLTPFCIYSDLANPGSSILQTTLNFRQPPSRLRKCQRWSTHLLHLPRRLSHVAKSQPWNPSSFCFVFTAFIHLKYRPTSHAQIVAQISVNLACGVRQNRYDAQQDPRYCTRSNRISASTIWSQIWYNVTQIPSIETTSAMHEIWPHLSRSRNLIRNPRNFDGRRLDKRSIRTHWRSISRRPRIDYDNAFYKTM